MWNNFRLFICKLLLTKAERNTISNGLTRSVFDNPVWVNTQLTHEELVRLTYYLQ